MGIKKFLFSIFALIFQLLLEIGSLNVLKEATDEDRSDIRSLISSQSSTSASCFLFLRLKLSILFIFNCFLYFTGGLELLTIECKTTGSSISIAASSIGFKLDLCKNLSISS
jgi:hypothetical protein